MAKCKIVAHFADSNGNYSHADLTKPVFADDVRDQVAEQWTRNGWAIIIPEPKREREEPKVEEELIPKVDETAVETTALEGAPETTEGRGNRRGRRNK